MNGIQIKINGTWVNLAEDFELEFEQTSFVFNEQGAYSYPFEIPLAANRALVKNIADPFGKIHLAELDYTDAEIWFDGIMLYRGIVRTDNEVDLEDMLPFTFLSGGSDFQTRVEGMNMRDIPLDRDIKLGYVVTKAETIWQERDARGSLIFKTNWEVQLPGNMLMNFTESNVSDPYPVKPYCNVRVCTSDEDGHYKVLEARRPYSGVCFYVRYFIDCLFKYLEIPLDSSALDKMEDFNRLAFFTTQCHAQEIGDAFNVSLSTIRNKDFCGKDFELLQNAYWHNKTYKTVRHAEDYTYTGFNVYASNEDFPNESIDELFEDLRTAFGICMLYDGHSGRMTIRLLSDIFRDNSVKELNIPILECSLTQLKRQKIRLTYGIDDDTAFCYDDYTNKKEFNDYAEICGQGAASRNPSTYSTRTTVSSSRAHSSSSRPRGEGAHRRYQGQGFSAFDTTCYLDKKTGNAYRVKVNKNTGGAPSLFEVGGFNDFIAGNKNSKEEEKMEINFSPVIVNDVTHHVDNEDRGPSREDQVLAVFADVELKADKMYEGPVEGATVFGHNKTRDLTVEDPVITANCPENYDINSSGEAPLRTYDAGYTLGLMRGPGNSAAIEYTMPNYDSEGNDSFVFVESTYAFTADSCNNHGLFFDYNGQMAGGAEQAGRFSLKLSAKKMDGDTSLPIDAAYENRGLVSTFLAEYLYFMAHHKTVSLHVDMSVSQIINIDYSKRYRIGDYCGFINRISYSLSVEGIKDVVIEMYIL